MFFIFIFILILAFLYKLADYYVYRTLGFNSSQHLPMYTSGNSSSLKLVCVLGWGGCTYRQLRRLVEFYTSNGIATISYINPMYNYLFNIDQNQLENLGNLLLEKSLDHNRIYIHIHSNNGTLIWCHLQILLQSNTKYRELFNKIQGITLDSAPFIITNNTDRSLLSAAIGNSLPSVSILLNQTKYWHVFWTPLISYYLFIRFFYQRYLSSDYLLSEEKIRRYIYTIPVNIKQLYLYSSSDRLIPSETIEHVISEQRRREVNVQSHRFSDSPHVNHFRFYPDEYGNILRNFCS